MFAAIIWLLTGVLFGIGLCLGSMVNPTVVQGFLDITGEWNPTLLFVLVGAVVTTFAGYRLVWRRPAPWFGEQYHLPGSNRIDFPLIGGAIIFGVGWGLLGYCPGPAITSLASGYSEPLLFVLALVIGNRLAGRLS